MKLTNTLRDAFIMAAMDDVPHVDYDEQIRSLIMKKAVERLPKTVQALWKDPKMKGFIVTGTCRVGGGDSVGIGGVPGFDGSGWSSEIVGATAEESNAFFAQFDELVAKRKEQKAQRAALRSKLHAAAYSVTTRKALMTMLPEFDKYLPDDEVKANRQLPVVANLVSDFVKAGWPKSEHDRRAKVNTKLKAKGADPVPA